ncbi:MAG: glycoside hydrolase family 127 protein, partial [Clostridia bacterium]|nr:glycoside hydrolase family 127 protein [Clostridia bacterium]
GVMSFGKTSYYNDNPIIADYDCIEIYSKALTEKEVMQRANLIKTADDKQAVETQANAFVLDYNGGAKINLPNYVDDGVKVTWLSSNENAISKDGHVYPVTTQTVVSLMAVFSRGTESVSKSYDVTLSPFEKIEFDRQIFALKDVQIDQSSFYWEYMMANVDKFMFKLDRDRLLYNFRRICGVDTKGVSTYGGWISPESNGASQFEMHYISALARLTQSMPNYSYNGETASDRLAYMISALKECQENYAKIDPSNAGYVNAFSIENFEVIKTGSKKLSDGTTAWVPWYFMHKTLAGLYDTYTFATDTTTKNNAYTVLIGLADWCSNFLLEMNEQEMQKTITVEYGGITEVLYNVYALTGNANYYKAAQCFEETALFEKILVKEDPLSGLHSNTTIPKILGLCAAYEITGEEKYKTIAINFFDMVMQRTYSNGGTSYEEFWRSENQVEEARFVEETCCSYNMLYLTDYLYRWTGDKKYVEYYENVYLNHILSSIDVESGCKTYHVNTQFGYYKVYHTLDTTFWCCSCSGMESYSKLGIHVYYKIEGGVEVNLFTPSTLKYSNDISIVQSGNYLTDEKTTLKIVGGGNLKLKIRIPDWCKETYSVKLNNTTIVNPTVENGYVVIERNFENNDTIDFNMPMTYWLKDRLTKGETTSKTLFYGPSMLVADLGPSGENQILETMTPNFGAPYSGNIKNYMILDKDLQDCITKSVNGNFMTFTFTADNQTVNFVPFYQAYRIRYGMYLNYYDKTTEKNSASDYNEQDVDFVNVGHADYNSNNLQNAISSNSLKLASEGESKYIITERKVYGRFLTTFDITPSSVGGAINAGLYIHASNAQKDIDKINAFNIHLIRAQDSNSLDISVYRFDQAYMGKVAGGIITCDTHTINVKIVVSDGYVLVYINNSETPSFSNILDGVKCDGGYIGLRTLYCDVTFSNMLIKANEFDINYKYLVSALQQVQDLNGSLYTQASWENFSSVLNNCKNVNDNKTATSQTQVKELANNLLSAKENLVLKSTQSSSSSSSSSSVSQAPSSSSSSSSKEQSSSSSSSSSSVSQAPSSSSSSSSQEESSSSSSSSVSQTPSSSSEVVSSSSSQESSSSSETISSSSKPNTSVQPQPSKRGCGGNINSCYYLLGIALVVFVVIVKRIKQKNN